MSLRRVPLGLDVDGTLLDTWPRQLKLLDVCTQQAGLGPLDLEAVRVAKREGASNRDVLQAIAGTQADVDSVCAQWLSDVESDPWLKQDDLLPGVMDVLSELRKEGAILVLITARQRPEAVVEQLKDLGVLPYVKSIQVVSPFHAPQQKSQVLHAVGAYAYIGDTTSDAIACRGAKRPFFAVSTGQHSEQLLRSAGVANVSRCLAEAVSEVRSFVAVPAPGHSCR